MQADRTPIAAGTLHNPWDWRCIKHLATEPTRDDARCPICRPSTAAQTFRCPSCTVEELPDEVGTVVCEFCGAVIETTEVDDAAA